MDREQFDKIHAETRTTKLEQDNLQVWADYLTLRRMVEDLAAHGTRHDTNPTLGMSKDPMKVAMEYLDYLQSMDNSIRDRAKQVIAEIDSRHLPEPPAIPKTDSGVAGTIDRVRDGDGEGENL